MIFADFYSFDAPAVVYGHFRKKFNKQFTNEQFLIKF